MVILRGVLGLLWGTSRPGAACAILLLLGFGTGEVEGLALPLCLGGVV